MLYTELNVLQILNGENGGACVQFYNHHLNKEFASCLVSKDNSYSLVYILCILYRCNLDSSLPAVRRI